MYVKYDVQDRLHCLGISTSHLHLYLSHVFRHHLQDASAASSWLQGPGGKLSLVFLAQTYVSATGLHAQLCLQSPGCLCGLLLLQAGAADVQQRQAGNIDDFMLLAQLVPVFPCHPDSYELVWNTDASHLPVFRTLAQGDD